MGWRTDLDQRSSYLDRITAMMVESIKIETLSERTLNPVTVLIRNNLGAYEEVGSVLASSFRRVDNIHEVYRQHGSQYFVAVDTRTQTAIGGAGLGPLAGLPASEGIGEIRELVIQGDYRGRGIGTKILRHCLQSAQEFGYQRIYLETTPQMVNAQKLFRKFGFRPVTDAPQQNSGTGRDHKVVDELPCYYLLENIAKALKTPLHN